MNIDATTAAYPSLTTHSSTLMTVASHALAIFGHLADVLHADAVVRVNVVASVPGVVARVNPEPRLVVRLHTPGDVDVVGVPVLSPNVHVSVQVFAVDVKVCVAVRPVTVTHPSVAKVEKTVLQHLKPRVRFLFEVRGRGVELLAVILEIVPS